MFVELYSKLNYESAKRTEFLLAVIYGSPRPHSDSSKTFKVNWKKLKKSFMTISRPGPTVTVYFSDSMRVKDLKF